MTRSVLPWRDDWRCPASTGRDRTCRNHIATVVFDGHSIKIEDGPKGVYVWEDWYLVDWKNATISFFCNRHGFVAKSGVDVLKFNYRAKLSAKVTAPDQ